MSMKCLIKMLVISLTLSVVVSAADFDEDAVNNIGKGQCQNYDYRDIEYELEKTQRMLNEFGSIAQEQEAIREGIKLTKRDIIRLHKRLDVLEKLALVILKLKNSKKEDEK